MNDDDKVILIDAYSQIFRAFYAIRQLTNQRGEPVNAAYVFLKLLLKLDKSFPCRQGAMLFDCGKVAFRLKLCPAYKANRPPMPDALKSQMPLVRRIASAFGWPLLQYEGFEADDLIGGLTRKWSGKPILILTGDKDLSQLVDDRVKILAPLSGNGGGFEVRDAGAVEAKFGVPPALIVDYLALLGDNSDNISGVPGIGPKGAAELLNTFGGSAQWLDHPELLANSRFAKKLEGNWELLHRNLELVKLRTELPDALAGGECLQRREPDYRELAEICRDNQFQSILKELPAAPPQEETEKSAASEAEQLELF